MGPWVKMAMEGGFAARWWFIRYGDPDWHLRVRFYGDPAALTGQVLADLYRRCGPFLEGKLLWKVQLDSYQPELERYGAGMALGMGSAEGLFHADSEAVLALLEGYPGDAGSAVRWRLGLLGMDMLLDDLGFALWEKLQLMQGLRTSHFSLFNLANGWEAQLGLRFRKERSALESLLAPDAIPPLAMGRAIFGARSKALGHLPGLVMGSGVPKQMRATSYLHMFAHRLFRASHRAQEAVLYDFLFRLYRSQAARLNSNHHPT